MRLDGLDMELADGYIERSEFMICVRTSLEYRQWLTWLLCVTPSRGWAEIQTRSILWCVFCLDDGLVWVVFCERNQKLRSEGR